MAEPIAEVNWGGHFIPRQGQEVLVGLMQPESRAKPRFAASTITSLELSIKPQAQLAEIEAGERLVRQAEAGLAAYTPRAAIAGVQGDLEQAEQPFSDLYLKWLKEGEFTAQNLVMRALALNQQALIDQLAEADAAPVDLRAFPSDAVATAAAAFLEKMPATANAQLAALLAGLSGPALKYWDEFHAGKVGSKAAAAMAAASGKQIVRLPVVGSRGDFVQAFVRQLYMLDPTLKTNPNQLQKAVAAQIRLLEIEGVKMQGNGNLGWYVVLDREAVAGATASNRTGQALADELAKAVRRSQDLRKLELAQALKWRGVGSLGATGLTGVLMVLNFGKLLEDVEKGMSHELAEAQAKLMAGKVALAGFVAEQLGTGLEKVGEQRLRNMAGRFGGYLPNLLKFAGRFAGFGVGVFLGLWDISKGAEADKSGDTGMANAYYVAGGAGILVSGTLLGVAMGWIVQGPIGWLVLAVGVLIWLGAVLFVETSKDNPLQEWLARCYFGAASDKYPDTAVHLEQYKLALSK